MVLRLVGWRQPERYVLLASGQVASVRSDRLCNGYTVLVHHHSMTMLARIRAACRAVLRRKEADGREYIAPRPRPLQVGAAMVPPTAPLAGVAEAAAEMRAGIAGHGVAPALLLPPTRHIPPPPVRRTPSAGRRGRSPVGRRPCVCRAVVGPGSVGRLSVGRRSGVVVLPLVVGRRP